MCGECNWSTELTKKDMEKTYDKLMKSSSFFPKCNWCNESHFVREVGPNYICPDCESTERAAGRPLIFTSPVRDSYFKIDIFLTVIEAAKINKVTPQAIHFAIRTKRLPAKKENNQWRIHLEDLVSYNKTKYIREKNKDE